MSGESELRFKGTPNRLSAVVEKMGGMSAASTCRVKLAEDISMPISTRAFRPGESSPTLITFRLPKSTAPGIYKGTMELGDKQIPIEVEVEPRPSVRFLRPSLVRSVRPGGRFQTELVLINRGNVSVMVPQEDQFCVFDDAGIPRAVYRGLVAEEGDGEERLDRILDELAKAHGGLVRVTVTRGSGRLAPEEMREIQAEFLFSRRLIAGHIYRGTWQLSEASLDLKIEVPAENKEVEP
jgi:hypothetical protein